MVDYEHRPLTGGERYVSDYCSFVDEVVRDGYDDGCFEYANDIGCRQQIEEHRADADVSSMWARVEEADRKLKLVLSPTVRCIFGEYPRSCFWFWGYPHHSPELERELRESGDL
jgi:hypothetical protein